MLTVALPIGNEVSYVTRIKRASHSEWQAQYLVKFTPGIFLLLASILAHV